MFCRNHRRHILHGISVVMSMLMKFQDILYQFFFRLINIEYRNTGKLELRAVTGEDNRFSLPGKEESVMLHIDLCGDKIMGVHIRRIIH